MVSIPSRIIGGGGDARSALVNPNVPRPRFDLSAGVSLARAIEEKAKEDERALDGVRAVELEGEYARRAEEIKTELDPLAPDYSDRLREGVSGVRDELLTDTGITTPETFDRLSTRLAAAVENDHLFGVTERRSAIQKNGQRVYDEAKDAILAKIEADPDASGLFVDQFSSTAAGVAEAIGPEGMRVNAETFADQAIEAEIVGLAKMGRHDEARALLKARGGEFTAQSRRALAGRLTEIKNGQLGEAIASRNVANANFKIAISKATTAAELAAIERQIDLADNEGKFPGSLQATRAALIVSIEAKRDALARGGRALAEALAKSEAGALDTQENADLVYEHETSQLPPDASLEDRLGHLGEFAARTGWVPKPAKSIIKNGEQTGDPQRLAEAYVFNKAITDRSPSADTGAGDRMDLMAGHVELLEMDPLAAADRIVQRAPDRATAAQRDEQFAVDFSELDPDGLVREALDAEASLIPEFLGGAPGAAVPARVANDAERLLRLHYRMTGDKAVAEAAAANGIRRRYGLDKVNRTAPVVMRRPPMESYFPEDVLDDLRKAGGETSGELGLNDDTIMERIIREDVEGMLDALGVAVPPAPSGAEDTPAWVLRTTESTIAEADASGKRGIWEVWTRDEFGNHVPLLLTMQDGTRQVARVAAPAKEEFGELPAVRDLVGEMTQDFVSYRALREEMGIDDPLPPQLLALAERFREEESTIPGALRTKRKRALKGEAERLRALGDFELGDISGESRAQMFGNFLTALYRYSNRSIPPPPGRKPKLDTTAPISNVGENEEMVGSAVRGGPPPVGLRPDLRSTPPSLERRPGQKGQQPRGIRNNNPGNLGRTGDKWVGMAADQSGDDRFVVFTEPKYGLRAMARVLTVKHSRGSRTIEAILRSYAPKNENDTEAYINTVAKRSGFRRDQVLDFSKDETLLRVMRAMIHVENGVQPYSADVILEGIRLAR